MAHRRRSSRLAALRTGVPPPRLHQLSRDDSAPILVQPSSKDQLTAREVRDAAQHVLFACGLDETPEGTRAFRREFTRPPVFRAEDRAPSTNLFQLPRCVLMDHILLRDILGMPISEMHDRSAFARIEIHRLLRPLALFRSASKRARNDVATIFADTGNRVLLETLVPFWIDIERSAGVPGTLLEPIQSNQIDIPALALHVRREKIASSVLEENTCIECDTHRGDCLVGDCGGFSKIVSICRSCRVHALKTGDVDRIDVSTHLVLALISRLRASECIVSDASVEHFERHLSRVSVRNPTLNTMTVSLRTLCSHVFNFNTVEWSLGIKTLHPSHPFVADLCARHRVLAYDNEDDNDGDYNVYDPHGHCNDSSSLRTIRERLLSAVGGHTTDAGLKVEAECAGAIRSALLFIVIHFVEAAMQTALLYPNDTDRGCVDFGTFERIVRSLFEFEPEYARQLTSIPLPTLPEYANGFARERTNAFHHRVKCQRRVYSSSSMFP